MSVHVLSCSLPGIITPMKDKSHLQRIVAMAFGSVVFVYLLLFITSGLAFGTSQTCKCELVMCKLQLVVFTNLCIDLKEMRMI